MRNVKFTSFKINKLSICFLAFVGLLILGGDLTAQNPKAVFTSYSSQDSKDEELPKMLSRKFRRDAARLALRLEAENEDLRFQNIVIPQENVELIFNILSDIYLESETAQSISKCNVHTFPNPSIDHLVLIFDREVDWASPLQDGISETDSDEINELIDDFDLIIDKHVQWNETEDAITIRSKEPLNMSALANEFYNVEGINSIDLGVPKIGGNDILLKRLNDGWEVEYILKFGSYIKGKGKSHNWTYKALDDGSIKFISEEGDPIPEWMRCHFEDLHFARKG